MAAAEHLVRHPEIPHGAVRVAFTPDEEIGRGANHFDVARFGAVCAYTLDGGGRGELEFESFSADAMTVTFKGFNTHPGYAKGRMVNAIRVAADFVARLPRDSMRPRPPKDTKGTCIRTRCTPASIGRASRCCVRDFATAASQGKGKARRSSWRGEVVRLHPGSSVEFAIEESYRNMREVLEQHPQRRRLRAPTRFASPAWSRSNARSAAAPTGRACRSWACRRPTCSPANTTSTRAWSGSPPRTWTRRSK